MIYLPLSAPEYHPIQLKLYNIINNLPHEADAIQEGGSPPLPAASGGMKTAAVMFAAVPILAVYPWLQKYFIHSVTIGAIKE
jgi:putative aldouronate transport system permease protein